MRFIDADIYHNQRVDWTYHRDKTTHVLESVRITVTIGGSLSKKEAIALASDVMLREKPHWFISGGYRWNLDLDKIRQYVDVCKDLAWLTGRIVFEPEYKLRNHESIGRDETILVITLIPEDISRGVDQNNSLNNTDAIASSLAAFQRDYPNPMKHGFIIMQFSDTKAHRDILDSIKGTLVKLSLKGLRADDKEYSDDLLTNIRTYMHGCGFGIAVFERLLADDFNPNMSLEVGYMMAQRKPVIYLKDQTLKNLHTDIIGKLYRNFDPQDPHGTIPNQLENWLRDKSLI